MALVSDAVLQLCGIMGVYAVGLPRYTRKGCQTVWQSCQL